MVQVAHPRKGKRKCTKSRVLARLLTVLAIATVAVNFLAISPAENASSSFFREVLLQNKNASLLTITKLPDGSYDISFPKLSVEEGRRHILGLFQEAGVPLTPQMEASLPTWAQVQEVMGPHPYIIGLENCEAFRRQVPPLERMLGSAGMFNSGTNLVTHLLKQNCEIPERRAKVGPHQAKESYGMRWQVPWGKHTPAKFRDEHSTQKAMQINKDFILPIVTLRNPYTWLRSTCKNPYTASWPHRRNDPGDCPALKDRNTGDWNGVTVRYGAGEDHHKSVAHLWNDWYSYYIREATFPWIAIRMEDLVFYPKETIHTVCECAGGKIRTDQDFVYIVDSAKADSPGHDTTTGIYAAWIKYSKPPSPKFGFSEDEYQATMEALDAELMESFGYKHPPAE